MTILRCCVEHCSKPRRGVALGSAGRCAASIGHVRLASGALHDHDRAVMAIPVEDVGVFVQRPFIVRERFEQPELAEVEARRFACNAVVVGRTTGAGLLRREQGGDPRPAPGGRPAGTDARRRENHANELVAQRAAASGHRRDCDSAVWLAAR